MNDRLLRLVGPGEPELSCDECFEHLDEYIDVQLSGGDADRAVPRMAAHLAGCPACATEHDDLRDFLAEETGDSA